MKKKARIDQTLVERGFFESRERAQRAVMAGEVRVGEQLITKPSAMIDINAAISVADAPKFVGRGGIVREPALHEKAQQKIVNFVEEAGYRVVGLVPSIITGTDGNQEFFICIRKRSD